MSQSRGRPLRLNAYDVDRFRSRVLATSTCAIWLGAVGADGYGRFSLRQPGGGRERMVTPHQVAAVLAFGELAEGVTLLHDCDVRLCVRTGPGHVRVGTQAENMRQAAWRGRARGPRPGLVDVRGRVGASRAVQKAMRASTDRSPDGLARVLAEALAAGDPLRHHGRLWG
ncbi:MAG: hypothetical protein ACJ74U_15300 [Jatrophihabitantaceae bacterium]